MNGPIIRRRRLLAALVSAMAAGPWRIVAPDQGRTAAASYLVPGYQTGAAYHEGTPLALGRAYRSALGKGYDGPVTLVTRVHSGTGEVRRALHPVRGHAISVHPCGESAVFSGMNHPRLVQFDPVTLEVTARVAPHVEEFTFGGHAVFDPGGDVVYTAERFDYDEPYRGHPEAHFGRIGVRDARTLVPLDSIDCRGIAPHEIVLLDGGRYLACANYGSTVDPDDYLPNTVEPSLTLIETASGRLVEKWLAPDLANEIRHLAGAGPDRILAVQNRLALFADVQQAMEGRDEVYQPDRSERFGRGYLPVPLFAAGRGTPPREVAVANLLEMHRAQSIVYDDVNDEYLVTFASSNRLGVVSGAVAGSMYTFTTDRLGLHRPRGVALLPGGAHYAVSGHWRDIYVFERGSHRLVREACQYVLLFGHSHLTVV